MAERSYLEEAVRYDYSRKFVKRCADVFHWEDLSEHVVMDIGCGAELNCCHAILVQFPRVRALIAVDKESTVFQKALLEGRRIHFCVGDIQERDSLKSYEGKQRRDPWIVQPPNLRTVLPTVPRRRYTSEVLLFWIFSYLWNWSRGKEKKQSIVCVCEEESF
ncbi:jhamt [Trichonephila clavata]|uniref:Jhamt n=1 Tax=Trichonephila clavata TaxID=2740835 RepID=A0A8X6M287_TRICU|nr:jhamt [Trichonephila clavata]